MAPCTRSDTGDETTTEPLVQEEHNVIPEADIVVSEDEKEAFKFEIVWGNVYNLGVLHLLALWGFYNLIYAKWATIGLAYVLYIFGGLGITAGAHRLWSHRCYKATPLLRGFLMLCQTLAGQDDLYHWSRDHRVHHKWSETNADPYNANRGMFFSHIGWLMMKKHPDVNTYGKKLNYDDLLNDPIVHFQKKYYMLLFWTVCIFMPTIIPTLMWGESLLVAFTVTGVFRYVFTLHMTWLVNSLAHYYGMRPYNKDINPAENRWVSFWAIGEGFHNFHHSFPHDYKTSEYGWKLNLTSMFIDLMSVLGQAYDLRTVKKETIDKLKDNKGDPSGHRHLFLPSYNLKEGKVE